jgi:hypothetical protein
VIHPEYAIFDTWVISQTLNRFRGRAVRQSSAKASTAVRICSEPQKGQEEDFFFVLFYSCDILQMSNLKMGLSFG